MNKKYVIYQMKREDIRKFRGLSSEDFKNLAFRREDFNKVYEGEIKLETNSIYAVLDELFYIFNMQHPNDFKGHSMSVSDVVILNDKAYYCDTFGWTEINLI